ncbi:polyprenyl synthetase family protein [Williamsia sp. CHRR-6]|nr:polyprenyl synthetase family protein [Williamsia sp. CHRR-6]
MAEVPAAAKALLHGYFLRRRADVAQISPQTAELIDQLETFTLGGGKRVRPTFAWAGFRCAGGDRTSVIADPALQVCSALELIQACALIHDDVIDRSDTRRGNPTVHRSIGATHGQRQWSGDGDHFGVSTAVLLGDLALCWADDMVAEAALPVERSVAMRPIWSAMRTEVLVGQLLDITVEASGSESVEDAFQVMRFKTAAYTVSRPLQLGAALAGADDQVIDMLGAIGDGLGIAFQLRDDLLGAFGDPAKTGKPSGDDLVAGKRTALLALALKSADESDPAAAQFLRQTIGHPMNDDELTRVRAILHEVGAVRAVEDDIDRLVEESLATLAQAPFDAAARTDLTATATAIAGRQA